MKKVILSVFILCAGIFSLSAAKIKKNFEPIEFEPVILTGEGYIIEVSPIFDLVYQVGRLAEIKEYSKNWNNSYLDQNDALFERYKNHKAVQTLKNLMKKGIYPGDLDNLAANIKPDFSGTTCDLEIYPEVLGEGWRRFKPKEIYEFIEQLHNFAEESNFARIFALHRSNNLSLITHFKDYLTSEEVHIIPWIRDITNNPEETVHYVMSYYIQNLYNSCKSLDSNGNSTVICPVAPSMSLGGYLSAACYTYVSDYANECAAQLGDGYKNYLRSYILAYNESISAKDYDKSIKKNPEAFLFNIKFNITNIGVSAMVVCYFKEYEPENYGERLQNLAKLYKHESYLSFVKIVENYFNNKEEYKDFKSYWPVVTEFLNNLEPIPID